MSVWETFCALTAHTRANFWSVTKYIWIWLCNIFYWIFYKKPLLLGRKKGLQYHHLTRLYYYAKIVAIVNWGVPLILFLVWYFIIIQGCTSIMVRGYIEEICTEPYLSPKNEVPWYLDLWHPQGIPIDHSMIHIPLHIENIMTGHMKLRNTAMALNHQASKTELMAPGFVTQKMLSDLSEFNILSCFS